VGGGYQPFSLGGKYQKENEKGGKIIKRKEGKRKKGSYKGKINIKRAKSRTRSMRRTY
jgi:hypothetical protein